MLHLDSYPLDNKKKLIRRCILIYLLATAFVAASSIVIFTRETEAIRKINKSEAEHHIYFSSENIKSYLKPVIDDLLTISENEILNGYLNNNITLDRVEKEFFNISKNKLLYHQIRLIDTEGNETIRIENPSNKPILIPKESLQNKKHRYYFTKSFDLDKGHVYISPLDLNIEDFKVKEPYVPMIRFATPVFDKKENKKGIVIINYKGEYLLNRIAIQNNEGFSKIWLLNNEGYWLLSDNKNHEWGFMLPDKGENTVAKKYAKVWDYINATQNGNIYDSDYGYFAFRTIYPMSLLRYDDFVDSTAEKQHQQFENQPRWIIAAFIPSAIYNTQGGKVFSVLIYANGLSFLFFAVFLFYYYKSNIKKIAQEQSMYKLSRAIQQSTDAILITDNNGISEYANNSYMNISGLKSEEIIGKEAMYLNDIAIDSERLEKAINHLKSGHQFKGIIKRKNFKGDTYYEDLFVSPIKDNNGKIVNYISTGRDITKQVLSTKKLAKNEKKLVELNATKDKFFSIIAHDLKNPFLSLMGSAELIAESFDSLEQEEIKVISKDIYVVSGRIYALLENLLEWSRIQTGSMEANHENLQLKKLIENVLSLYKLNALRKKITFSFDLNNNCEVIADEKMISTVLRNLVSNAIKFSPIRNVIAIETSRNCTHVEVSVKDNGIGISKEDTARLFRIDTAFSTRGTNNEKGTGLGLVLSKELMEMNNGKLSVESEVGKGSTFTFTVPLAESK